MDTSPVSDTGLAVLPPIPRAVFTLSSLDGTLPSTKGHLLSFDQPNVPIFCVSLVLLAL